MPETLPQEVSRLIDHVGPGRVMRELGVHRTTLMRWRHAKVTIPPAQLMALRALAYHVGTDPKWEGWRFHDGQIWSPEGYGFHPWELLAMRFVIGERDYLRDEVKALRAKVAALSVDPHVRGESSNDAAIPFIPASPQPRVA